MSTFGDRLKLAREAKGYNQARLANMCEVSSSAIISNWEKNNNKPDIGNLVKLCIALDVTPAYLLDFNACNSDALTADERDFVHDLRKLDQTRYEIVKKALHDQLEILHNWNKGYTAVSPLPITTPVFLPKDDPQYVEMKVKCRELYGILKERHHSYDDVTDFLWQVGYADYICLAYVIGIIKLGNPVPNQQLYHRIKAFLEGRYTISIDGDTP